MRTVRILSCGLLLLVVTVSPVRADDPCLEDEEEKSAKAAETKGLWYSADPVRADG